MKALVFVLLATAVLAAPALSFAHEPRRGPNGGTLVDAGSYHVELVARGAVVDVFVTDASDRPVSATGFKATAVLVVDGKSHRVALVPADGSRLSGTAPAPLPVNPKGALLLTSPDGKSAQGKFN